MSLFPSLMLFGCSRQGTCWILPAQVLPAPVGTCEHCWAEQPEVSGLQLQWWEVLCFSVAYFCFMSKSQPRDPDLHYRLELEHWTARGQNVLSSLHQSMFFSRRFQVIRTPKAMAFVSIMLLTFFDQNI